MHSAFSPPAPPDFSVNVPFGNKLSPVYVLKRPGVDAFLARCAKFYEVVVFTASVSEYADAVLNVLDRDEVITHRLYREHCTVMPGGFVKDLSRINRDPKGLLLVDVSFI